MICFSIIILRDVNKIKSFNKLWNNLQSLQCWTWARWQPTTWQRTGGCSPVTSFHAWPPCGAAWWRHWTFLHTSCRRRGTHRWRRCLARRTSAWSPRCTGSGRFWTSWPPTTPAGWSPWRRRTNRNPSPSSPSPRACPRPGSRRAGCLWGTWCRPPAPTWYQPAAGTRHRLTTWRGGCTCAPRSCSSPPATKVSVEQLRSGQFHQPTRQPVIPRQTTWYPSSCFCCSFHGMLRCTRQSPGFRLWRQNAFLLSGCSTLELCTARLDGGSQHNWKNRTGSSIN